MHQALAGRQERLSLSTFHTISTKNTPPGMCLQDIYLPSDPCSCEICSHYCTRPGWWTPEEAERVLATGYASRMMLEVSPELTLGVLSPAFRGSEGNFATQEYSGNGCTFLTGGMCELHGTGFQPLECRFCHHDRVGQGIECHSAIEASWQTPKGKKIVNRWIQLVHFRSAEYYYTLLKSHRRPRR